MIGKNSYPKRRPVGCYEKLLCKNCEATLGVYDNYAQKLLLKNSLNFYPNTNLAYVIEEFDYTKLKLFFISLLWRASISRLEEFSHIDVGQFFEERLRELILSESVGEIDEFSITIAKFDSDNDKIKRVAEKNILFPAKQKLDDGKNYSIFYLSNGYKIYIKVDKRKSSVIYEKMIIKKEKPLLILRLNNFENSPEFRLLLDAIK